MPAERLTLVPSPRPDAASQAAREADLGDDDLMKLTAADSRTAFRTLVARYQARVIGVCVRSTGNPEEGREIAQEVFVALWQAAPRYVPAGTFPSFLFTIVRNQLRSAARKRATAQAAATELKSVPLDDGEVPLDQLLAAENQRRLGAALGDLSEVHRQALLLRFTADLPYEEIASICEAPVGTVRSWVHHGIQKLRTMLGEAS